jgi:FtsP/CotA-like multicopper oxidase with cupredoxin domain
MMDGMSMPIAGDPIFVINKKAGSDIPAIGVGLGDVRSFHIHNVSHQIHIFHLHGFFFQIVDTDDQYDPKINPLGLHPEIYAQAEKDTITVRSGYSVTIVGKFDNPGKWMFHCHIPEHSERGMMAEVHVGVP